MGIVVTKRIGNAVTRNYEKRTLREIFRKHIPQFRVNFDIIVILKRSNIDFFEKQNFFEYLVDLIEKRL